MFRYFGFSWNPAATAQAAAATRLEESVRSSADWLPAFSASGIRIFTVGHRPGVNGVHSLSPGQGVIMGQVFRRQGHLPDCAEFGLADRESERILQTRGRALIADYWGRYVALLRPDPGSTLLLRDPSGALPCYRQDVDGMTVFFSWLEDWIAFAPTASTPRMNWDAIAARLALSQLGGRETALGGVEQVMPGELTMLGEGAPAPLALWSAHSFAKHPFRQEPRIAAARLRELVVECAQAWSSHQESILLRLSGGVDSAILLGSLAAESSTTKITCLNYHSPGSDSDERSFARLAATRAGVELVERKRDSSIRLDELLAAARMPTPENYLGRLGTGRVDAEVANAHAARAMFTGIGGDQLFFQLRHTWPAADYLRVNGFDRGFIRVCLDAARLGRVSLLESIRQAVSNRRHVTNPLDDWGHFARLAHRDALDSVHHPERYVHPALLHASDLPIGKYNQLLALVNPGGCYDPYLREAAPQLMKPLLSQPIIEWCLSTPTWLLAQGGRGRGLLRSAFAGYIPREIATRQSKGGMDEHVSAILRHNLPFAKSLLLDGQLVRQGLLDRNKVESALSGRLSAADGYVSEIHECIAVEAWAQRMAAGPR